MWEKVGNIPKFAHLGGREWQTVLMTGEYRTAVDEKGRLLIPARIRTALGDQESLIVTRSVDSCLWILLPQTFENIRKNIMDHPAAMLDSNIRLLQRRLIAPAMELEIDKSGRINIPAQLRESIGLQIKADSMLLGLHSHIEVWSLDGYSRYLRDSESEFIGAAQVVYKFMNGGGH